MIYILSIIFLKVNVSLVSITEMYSSYANDFFKYSVFMAHVCTLHAELSMCMCISCANT